MNDDPARTPTDDAEEDDKSYLYETDPPRIGYKTQFAIVMVVGLCAVFATRMYIGRNAATIAAIVVCLLLASAYRNHGRGG